MGEGFTNSAMEPPCSLPAVTPVGGRARASWLVSAAPGGEAGQSQSSQGESAGLGHGRFDGSRQVE